MQMRRGEVWFAATPGGDRPVLVMTRDPVAATIKRLVVAQITSTVRGLESELILGPDDGMPFDCVASFDTVLTLDRQHLRRRVTQLDEVTMHRACERLNMALGC